MKKILFLLKKNNIYGSQSYGCKSGLLHSARMVQEYLNSTGKYKTHIHICNDANDIDREVTHFRPHICILEAIWVTPDKLRELTRLHPKVMFVIRIHSEMSFLANEGMAVRWIKDYDAIPNVKVAFNSIFTFNNFNGILKDRPFYLPNIYDHVSPPHRDVCWWIEKIFQEMDISDVDVGDDIHIGCFGAIRPMKNQLLQAMAAQQFAYRYDTTLHFHINADRVEQGGENVLKNIRSLFAGSGHYLVEHPWLDHHDFLSLIKQMDVGMQVSFNESFNLVSADFVRVDVPIVVSAAIRWMPKALQASTIDEMDMIEKLEQCFKYPHYLALLSKRHLAFHNCQAKLDWAEFLAQ